MTVCVWGGIINHYACNFDLTLGLGTLLSFSFLGRLVHWRLYDQDEVVPVGRDHHLVLLAD